MEKNKFNVLVIGGIKKAHDALIKENCQVTWFAPKASVVSADLERTYYQVYMYDENISITHLTSVAKIMNNEKPFDAVCAFHDEMQSLALSIAKQLGIGSDYSENTLNVTRNKYEMRRVLSQLNICSTQSVMVNKLDDIKKFVTQAITANKFILKPVDGTGSADIRVLSSFDLEPIEQLVDTGGLQFPLLLEEYIEGKEYSVEGFTQKGEHHVLAITEKFKAKDSFIETGHLVPALLDKCLSDKITIYIKQSLTALGITSGPTHSEIIINGDDIFMVETHTRVGGDLIPMLVELALGIDIYKLMALQVMNKEIKLQLLQPNRGKQFACIQYMVQEPSVMEIKNVKGIDEIDQLPHVKDVFIRFKAGEKLPAVEHSFHRAASVLVVDDSYDGALSAATDALSKIIFEFKSDAISQ